MLHLNGDEMGTIGHYVVWLPSSTPHRVDMWAGLPGVQSGPASSIFDDEIIALLTSPTSISTLDGVVDTQTVLSSRLRIVAELAIVCIFVVLVRVVWLRVGTHGPWKFSLRGKVSPT